MSSASARRCPRRDRRERNDRLSRRISRRLRKSPRIQVETKRHDHSPFHHAASGAAPYAHSSQSFCAPASAARFALSDDPLGDCALLLGELRGARVTSRHVAREGRLPLRQHAREVGRRGEAIEQLDALVPQARRRGLRRGGGSDAAGACARPSSSLTVSLRSAAMLGEEVAAAGALAVKGDASMATSFSTRLRSAGEIEVMAPS